eukprot:9473952-Pyramimonas_sp.AAC.1
MKAAGDKFFRESQVRGPSLERLARGGRGAPFRPEELIAQLVLPGGVSAHGGALAPAGAAGGAARQTPP